MRLLLIVAFVLGSCRVGYAAPSAPKAHIIIVGVAHLVAKNDLHNSTWGEDALSADMQSQIRDVVGRLVAFKPNKVMIEAAAADSKYVDRYKRYLAGTYTLGPNENDQFGYRLAALARNPTIYPIDTSSGFPFDYEAVTASATRNGQTSILGAADVHTQAVISKQNALEQQSRLLDVLRFVNTQEALDANASWYMYINRIGNSQHDYAGSDLVSFWYARNLHILANIMQTVRPGDRIVVFVGSGHAALLDSFVRLSPDLVLVDPESYFGR